jgi:predicted acylesterase/phospholipase RssA
VLPLSLARGRRYLDGGFKNNVPASRVVERGADFVIASSVVPLPRGDHLGPPRTFLDGLRLRFSPLQRLRDTFHATYLMAHSLGTQRFPGVNAVFEPDLSEFRLQPLRFENARRIVESARRDLEHWLPPVMERYKAWERGRGGGSG